MEDSYASQSPLILFAMKEELAAVPRLGAKSGWRWRREGKEFRLSKGSASFDVVISGPGRLNVIDTLKGRSPSAVINPGFAGSISRRFDVGQIARIASVRCGPELLEVTLGTADLQDVPDAKIVTAPAPLGAADKMAMFKDQAGDLVDMETFHVLNFCREKQIPFLGLRVVSDNLEDELPVVIKESFDGRQFQLRKIITRAIFSSKTRRELLKLKRSSQTAAEALADGLLKALELL
ncbi:MAG: nucleoside phosphorylase [Planctomycetota bacterium]|jgi:nucleoside phosphorylase